MTTFGSILHWSQIKQKYIVVFEIINWNWGDIILKVHCFNCCNKKPTIISSIKVYNWLTFSECSTLSEFKLLILDWIFSIRSSEWRVCIHCNSNPSNWSIVENVFLMELVLSGRNDESLCKNFPNSWNLQECKHLCPFVSCDNHPWEQYGECKVNNQQFQD